MSRKFVVLFIESLTVCMWLLGAYIPLRVICLAKSLACLVFRFVEKHVAPEIYGFIQRLFLRGYRRAMQWLVEEFADDTTFGILLRAGFSAQDVALLVLRLVKKKVGPAIYEFLYQPIMRGIRRTVPFIVEEYARYGSNAPKTNEVVHYGVGLSKSTSGDGCCWPMEDYRGRRGRVGLL
jgi:hypothetical protein